MNRPFNDAWLVLKRQTALSEYEGFEELEDMPVPNKPQKIGIPTHINRMIDPRDGNIMYSLMSGNTELGYITNDIFSDDRKKIENFGAYIEPDYRRQGLYQKLLNALIQNNYSLISNYRNEFSHPTHKKFQENLPANVNFSEAGKEFDVPSFEQTFHYRKKPSVDINYENPEPRYGIMGGMQRYDYGSLPIRNVDNPHDIEYENKPIHQRMLPRFSDPNNPYRQFMRLDEFSE
tara:strand:- start:105 stop:803 length:699 start_codon:yes stop_codon:yes gene_type:complete